MALKAVDRYRGIAVAAAAEVIATVSAYVLAIFAPRGVAVDALFKAVLACPYATVHCLVTLMQDVVHVVLAHLFDRFHALLCITYAGPGFGNRG